MNELGRRTNGRRGTLLALLVGAVLGCLAGQVMKPEAATAQVLPNSAAQRYDMVSELKAMNARLGSIEAYLRSGELTVVFRETGEKKPTKAAQ